MTAEIEDTFDVEESFALPDLSGIKGVASVTGPVEHQLEATYFDTPDLRLISAHVTLRRRTGGTDAGWHLKLGVDARTRTEIRRPLGRAVRKVPAPLVEQVRVYVRNDSLSPVVRIRTTRTVRELLDRDGEVLAEVADDAVTAEVLGRTAEIRSWRELEIELVEGGPALLDAAATVLRKAGARPSAVPSKLARALGDRLSTRVTSRPVDSSAAGPVILRYVRDQVERFQRCDPAVRTDQPDSVHQMRVAARRLRSVLKTYRPLFETELTEPVRAELRWFGGILGPARDAEVQEARFEAALGELPEELVLGPVAARLQSEFRGRYQRALAQLRADMNEERYFRLLDAVDDLVATPPFTDAAHKPAARLLDRRLHKACRSAARALAAAEDASPDEQTRLSRRHRARKAAKRARYTAEAAVPVLKSRAKTARKQMRAVQKALGEHRDAVLAAGELRTIGIQAHAAGENAFTYGLLLAQEQRNIETALRRYRKAAGKLNLTTRPG